MKTPEKLGILKDIGLSDQEISVYVGLLKMGGASATSLAEEMGIKRTTTYPILERLIAQGVVSEYEQGSKRFYSPLQPNKLAALFERKVQSLTSLVPFLEGLQGKYVKGQGIRFIQTKQELHSLYAEVLDEYRNREYYSIGNSITWLDVDKEFFTDFREKRAARNISVKLLLSHNSQDKQANTSPHLLRQFKYLPEKHPFKSTIEIFDDKIVIFGPETKALAVVIAIPPMVDVFRSVFQILWETLPA
ncbi:MAG: TrmB family transcriptional regulator [Candidatus Taylorbacteria bacterium]|nr:TrmB family transcriptional regulator [Candidatus Taylorbacteria bacterium]